MRWEVKMKIKELLPLKVYPFTLGFSFVSVCYYRKIRDYLLANLFQYSRYLQHSKGLEAL